MTNYICISYEPNKWWIKGSNIKHLENGQFTVNTDIYYKCIFKNTERVLRFLKSEGNFKKDYLELIPLDNKQAKLKFDHNEIKFEYTFNNNAQGRWGD